MLTPCNRVWKEALDQGVIPKSLEEEIPRATAAFADLSADKLLTAAAPSAVSPLKDLLQVAQLEPEQQQQFAALYVENRTDLGRFWDTVKRHVRRGRRQSSSGERKTRPADPE